MISNWKHEDYNGADCKIKRSEYLNKKKIGVWW